MRWSIWQCLTGQNTSHVMAEGHVAIRRNPPCPSGPAPPPLSAVEEALQQVDLELARSTHAASAQLHLQAGHDAPTGEGSLAESLPAAPQPPPAPSVAPQLGSTLGSTGATRHPPPPSALCSPPCPGAAFPPPAAQEPVQQCMQPGCMHAAEPPASPAPPGASQLGSASGSARATRHPPPPPALRSSPCIGVA